MFGKEVDIIKEGQEIESSTVSAAMKEEKAPTSQEKAENEEVKDQPPSEAAPTSETIKVAMKEEKALTSQEKTKAFWRPFEVEREEVQEKANIAEEVKLIEADKLSKQEMAMVGLEVLETNKEGKELEVTNRDSKQEKILKEEEEGGEDFQNPRKRRRRRRSSRAMKKVGNINVDY